MLKSTFFSFIVISSILIISCNSDKAATTFTDHIETAHQKTSFLEKVIVEFDLLLKFNGQERLNGTFTLSTNSENGIIEEKNGDELYYLKDQVFYKDRDSLNLDKLRFKAYTWSYFFLFPYKLTDPGVNWEDYENKKLTDQDYLVKKMTFKKGTGDSPDDWYIVYADSVSHLIHASAYIVTYTKSQSEAEEDPHAIVYEDYKEIDGVPIAHKWTFWEWRDGQLNKQLGEAILSNFSFLNKEDRSFAIPDGFKEIQ